ncbi:hypothetical protein ACEPAI_4892 [Sanghuangporus weigelae]
MGPTKSTAMLRKGSFQMSVDVPASILWLTAGGGKAIAGGVCGEIDDEGDDIDEWVEAALPPLNAASPRAALALHFRHIATMLTF